LLFAVEYTQLKEGKHKNTADNIGKRQGQQQAVIK